MGCSLCSLFLSSSGVAALSTNQRRRAGRQRRREAERGRSFEAAEDAARQQVRGQQSGHRERPSTLFTLQRDGESVVMATREKLGRRVGEQNQNRVTRKRPHLQDLDPGSLSAFDLHHLGDLLHVLHVPQPDAAVLRVKGQRLTRNQA